MGNINIYRKLKESASNKFNSKTLNESTYIDSLVDSIIVYNKNLINEADDEFEKALSTLSPKQQAEARKKREEQKKSEDAHRQLTQPLQVDLKKDEDQSYEARAARGEIPSVSAGGDPLTGAWSQVAAAQQELASSRSANDPFSGTFWGARPSSTSPAKAQENLSRELRGFNVEAEKQRQKVPSPKSFEDYLQQDLTQQQRDILSNYSPEEFEEFKKEYKKFADSPAEAQKDYEYKLRQDIGTRSDVQTARELALGVTTLGGAAAMSAALKSPTPSVVTEPNARPAAPTRGVRTTTPPSTAPSVPPRRLSEDLSLKEVVAELLSEQIAPPIRPPVRLVAPPTPTPKPPVAPPTPTPKPPVAPPTPTPKPPVAPPGPDTPPDTSPRPRPPAPRPRTPPPGPGPGPKPPRPGPRPEPEIPPEVEPIQPPDVKPPEVPEVPETPGIDVPPTPPEVKPPSEPKPPRPGFPRPTWPWEPKPDTSTPDDKPEISPPPPSVEPIPPEVVPEPSPAKPPAVTPVEVPTETPTEVPSEPGTETEPKPETQPSKPKPKPWWPRPWEIPGMPDPGAEWSPRPKTPEPTPPAPKPKPQPQKQEEKKPKPVKVTPRPPMIPIPLPKDDEETPGKSKAQILDVDLKNLATWLGKIASETYGKSVRRGAGMEDDGERRYHGLRIPGVNPQLYVPGVDLYRSPGFVAEEKDLKAKGKNLLKSKTSKKVSDLIKLKKKNKPTT